MQRIEMHASNILPFDTWVQGMGKNPATGWRWRQRGWIETLNIAGRVYVHREAIAEFERRASAGEFSKEHKTPKRRSTP
jgi:hypothetical protein